MEQVTSVQVGRTPLASSDVAFKSPFCLHRSPESSVLLNLHHTPQRVHVRAADPLKAAIVSKLFNSPWFDWKGATPDHKAHFNLNLLQIVLCLFNVY